MVRGQIYPDHNPLREAFMVTFRVVSRFLAVTALFGLMACGSKAPEAAKTPEDAVNRVVEGLKKNEPVVLWDALPKSYQADVNGVIGEFASKMDAEVYNKAMAVFGKAVKVAKDKKDLIMQMADSPMGGALPMPKDQLKSQYGNVTDAMGAVADSNIKTLDGLKGLDVRKFLEGPGAKVMNTAMVMAKAAPIPVKPEMLNSVKAEKGAAEGMVKITANGKTEEIKFVKVDEKWIPEDMSKAWPQAIAEMKKEMAGLGEMAKQKDMILKQLDQADKMLDALAKAEKPEDLMKAMGGGM